LSNYGMEKGVFGRQDWGLMDSAKLGGGTFAVAGGSLLLRNAALGKVAAVGDNATPLVAKGIDVAAARGVQAGEESTATLGDVQRLFQGAPKDVQNGLANVTSDFSKGQVKKLTVDQALAQFTERGTSNALPGFEQQFNALTKVKETLNGGGMTLERAGSLLKGSGYKAPPGLAQAIEKFGADAKVSEVMNSDPALGKTLLGTTDLQRASALYHILPDAHGVALDGAATTGRMGSIGRALNPFTKLPGDRIPTWLQWNATRMTAGMGAALTYNLGTSYFDAAAAHDKGDSTADPLTVLEDTAKSPGTYIQSALMGFWLGNIKPAAPLFRSAGDAWSATRASSPGVLGWGKAAYEGVTTPLGGLGRSALNFLNPADGATLSQVMRQSAFLPTAYFSAPAAYLGYKAQAAGQPYSDALQDIGKPIQNEAPYTPPLIDPNTGEVVNSSTPPQAQKPQQKPRAGQTQPQGQDSGNQGGNASDTQINPNIQGNIR
jgi:hypothetical protein